MEFTAEQIAGMLNGKVEGDSSALVNSLAKIEEGFFGALSFLSNPKYEHFIYDTKSTICIVNEKFTPIKPIPKTLTLIRVEDAYACFAKLLNLYDSINKEDPRVEQPSFIDKSVKVGKDLFLGAFSYISRDVVIGDNVSIYPNVYIGHNVKIGEGTIIYSGVKIYHGSILGEKCVIHSGAVIGSDGFGFAPDENGNFQQIPQIGNVVLEDSVNIGANTTIDRATMGSTIIRSGVKIDNLVQIAHNVDIGSNTAMAAQVGVAGSCKIGQNVMIGGQVGLAGHMKVGNNVKIAAQSGVSGDIKDGSILMGSPAFDNKEYKKSYLGFRRLPRILERIQVIEDKIKTLIK
ncbi:MAG: UDP-3-O-(3-hydroxymyristoyl)glucosamine N-acyltransferase [Crocinitomicaceae bacterium]|nr:UDP-3-O-(3-hydroxymyristoyl)glucosamine N-acyltransferase [Crocinitomicaceae bacterium]|tara:strand:- start:10905 stop:11942 length:1038 start_codon:yes stop_codon:yes gene_type:complete